MIYASKNSLLSLGLNGSYEQRAISPDNVSWDNQWTGLVYDPSLPSMENWGNQSHSYFDMATGIAWKYVQPNIGVSAFDKMAATAGISYYHLLNPEPSFYGFAGDERYGKIIAHAQGTFGLRDQYITINPGVFFAKQGPFNQLMVGSTFKYLFRSDTKYTGFENEKAIGIGFFVRGQDALIPSFIFEFRGFEFGINYDYTISTLQKANNGVGGFEISFIWQDTYGILFKQGDKHVMYLGE